MWYRIYKERTLIYTLSWRLTLHYIDITNTDLRTSRICLGTAGLGTAISRDDSFRLLDVFVAEGGNFLDSAHNYADWASDIRGMSERTIGEWLSTRGCRDSVVVATKGAHPRLDAMNIPRLSRQGIFSDLTESLEFLKIDTIDLYWLHRDDPTTPVSEILDVLEDARNRKMIRWYAASNWTTARLKEAADYAKRAGIPGMVASQVGWSLATLRPGAIGDPTMLFVNDEIHAYHESTGMPLIPYSSQANGFFSGKYSRPKPNEPLSGVLQLYGTEENFLRLERVNELSRQLGCTTNQIALAYLMSQPFPVIPIAGCRIPEQVADSCRAVDIKLTDDQIRQLRLL
jgi:aryl-alcohol dehydrogenase-like predicted oxidoreductase